MQLVSYEYQGRHGAGVRRGDEVIPTGFGSMLELIQAELPILERPQQTPIPLAACRILAPVPNPSKIVFSGLNYRSHLEENPGAVLPSYPQFFAKLPSSVIGPGEGIVLPGRDAQVDYEVELAAVIGSRAKGVSVAEALEYVFGYTVVNDVSGRDVQFRDNQITTGKGYDTFCPMGPVVVPRQMIGDPQALAVRSFVNDELRQSGSTADMLFSVATLIAFLSTHITLFPGDVIATGTPAGVGCFRTPPVYLRPGDTVSVEVEGIGRLTNPVVAGW